ncbi:hypothetical protein KUL42_28980 [Alteromonas sp. KUL42]|uniref:Ig-like domain-containing protein n=1 Tax=Alteromonas sp. KUL42 TaxID=2480797 RepID=UPI00103582F2|nr:hypothetical protein [Alteromonas sp. KUL42]TAP34067.1 hypothetical protein EYR97_13560 [Alteromonas sp. KUL42]GEA08137.1 hypothetical protein KUL42_28980 [Alteromonas sp. KUL42]
MNRAIAILSSLLILSACGGGGGDASSGSGNPSNGGNGGGGVTVNNAPVLSPIANFSMDENTTTTISLQASDADGDALTFDVSSTAAVTTSTSQNSLQITAGEVEENTDVTVSVTVNDGNGGSDSQQFTITVNNIIINTPPSVVLSSEQLELVPQQQEILTATLSDAESDVADLDTGISVSDPSVLTAGIMGDGNVEVIALSEGTSVITYTVWDEEGLSSTAQVNVTVLPEPDEPNEAPDFTIANEFEGNKVRIYHDRETVLNVIINDPDSSAHYLTMERFEAIAGSESFLNSYLVNNANRTITFDMKALPINQDEMRFEVELKVVDDSDNETTKVYELIVEKSDNAAPIFTFSEKEGAFIIVKQNGTTEITYTIEDDDVSKVKIEGVEYWYGDQEKFDVQLDEENNGFTVHTENVEVEDAYGFAIKYSDVSLVGTVNVELMVGATFGEDEQEMLDRKHRMFKARESIKEYVHIGVFYSQVLENMGVITQQQAEDFIERLDVDDSEEYGYGRFNLYLNNIDYYITIGEFKDEGFKSSYITVLDNLFELAMSMGQEYYAILNEMAGMSLGVLPEITFERELNEYDEVNNYFSRFVGVELYGEYIDDEWVFDAQYSFMNAIQARMIENASRYIDEDKQGN